VTDEEKIAMVDDAILKAKQRAGFVPMPLPDLLAALSAAEPAKDGA
jgi:hypothetical protein